MRSIDFNAIPIDMVNDTVMLACFILILSSVHAFADQRNMHELQRLLKTKHRKFLNYKLLLSSDKSAVMLIFIFLMI